MNRLRNKKKVSILVTVFLLVFVVGSAYALATGQLEIGANITVAAPSAAEGSVVWADTEFLNPTFPFSGTQSVTGVGTQTLSWNIDFDDIPDTTHHTPTNIAMMRFAIANNSPYDIRVTNLNSSFIPFDPDEPLRAWGVTVNDAFVFTNDNMLPVVIPAGEIRWLGNINISRNREITPEILPDLDENGRLPVGTIDFTFDWEKIS